MLVPYITVGDGGLKYCRKVADALIAAGATALELGIPYTDPIADGPAIQAAMQWGLARGTTPSDVIDFAKQLRSVHSIPLVLFTYYNLLLAGGEAMLDNIAEAGIDALLVVDLPPEESAPLQRKLQERRIGLVPVSTPATPEERLQKLSHYNAPFHYYVCRKGVTGVKKGIPADFPQQIAKIREFSSLPIVAGFGIGSHQAAAAVQQHADGVVVGSAIVQQMARLEPPEKIAAFLQSLQPEVQHG
jgi:tryptophan synthase alpha chain